jgi:hypothetical protein
MQTLVKQASGSIAAGCLGNVSDDSNFQLLRHLVFFFFQGTGAQRSPLGDVKDLGRLGH